MVVRTGRDLPQQFFKLVSYFQHDYNAMQVDEPIHRDAAHRDLARSGPDWVVDTGRASAATMCELPLGVVESFRPSPYVPIHLHVVVVGRSEQRQCGVTPSRSVPKAG